MTRFANPKAAQAMMQTHGHTNLGMPPKPGFPGTGAPTRPPRPGNLVIDNKPVPVLPRTRPPGPVTTGGPLVKPPPPGMVGLGQAMSNLGIKKGAGAVGAALGKRFGGLGMKKGGKVSSASKRADGCAVKGKTKGKMI